jgi:hypothetical protein
LAEELHDLLHRARATPDQAPLEECLRLWRRAEELGIRIAPWRLQNEIHRILENPRTELSGTLLELARALGFSTPEEPGQGG